MSDERNSEIARDLSRLGVLLYCASFIVPGHHFIQEPGGIWFWGTQMFFLGLMFFWVFPSTVSWFANGLFWIALLNRNRPKHARIWSFLAGLLALSFMVTGMGEPGISTIREMSSCLPYLLWMGSMFLYAFANHLKAESTPTEECTLQGEE